MNAELKGRGRGAGIGEGHRQSCCVWPGPREEKPPRWAAEIKKKWGINTEKSMVCKLGNLDFSLLSFI